MINTFAHRPAVNVSPQKFGAERRGTGARFELAKDLLTSPLRMSITLLPPGKLPVRVTSLSISEPGRHRDGQCQGRADRYSHGWENTTTLKKKIPFSALTQTQSTVTTASDRRGSDHDHDELTELNTMTTT